MIHQRIFREKFLVSLKGDLPANFPHYLRDDPWIDNYADGKSYSIDSRIVVPEGFSLMLPEGEDLKDFENTVRLHDVFKDLTRVQASDPRLWTYMTHATCWDYMRQRWKLEESRAMENARDYILTRYFIKSDQSRSLLRNGVARLWWYGHLTYDTGRENPYELTSILLKQLDIALQVLERSLGRSNQVLHGFLEFLLENPILTESGSEGRRRIRGLAISLNLHGGVCILDNLNKDEVKKFLSEVIAVQA